VETGSQRKVNQKGMQMYTDCTFVPLRVKYNETRTNFPFSQKRKEKKLAIINLAVDLVE